MADHAVPATSASSATVGERMAAAELRHRREAAGYTVQEVAVMMDVSASKISRIEHCRRGLKLVDAAGLLALYRVTGAEREALLDLCRPNTPTRGWCLATRELPRAHMHLESKATRVTMFDALTIPAPLQTPDYTRHLCGDLGLTPEETERRMACAWGRGEVLLRDRAPESAMFVSAAALSRLTGPAQVMAAQYEHLVNLAWRRSITFRVVPAEVSAPRLGAFAFYECEDLSPVVVLETPRAVSFVDGPSEVDYYAEAIGGLRRVALDADASVEHVRALLDAVEKESQ
ncbi:helix-turn-helix domain-containing protein [Streptoalloteichus hindustanus]|nr:helix-turn-helix transcriptional regulator [Streptoalloteichus hindustanus]